MAKKLKISWSKPTPKFAREVLNTLLYVSGVWELVIMPNLPDMPAHIEAQISKWLIISLAFMRFTINFFHLEETKPGLDLPVYHKN